MKKIIFIDIPMKKMNETADRQCYAGTGNADCRYTGTVVFPINAVLAEKLHKDDRIKAVLLTTITGKDHSAENAELFKRELDSINAAIGAHIDYEQLATDFVESKANHETRFRKLLPLMEDGTELYADITFGQKTLPMVLMCAFHFAERFFDADIKKIIYGKVEFIKHDDGRAYPENPELYDVTPLYYLNNLMGTMEAPNGVEALKALDAFFAL